MVKCEICGRREARYVCQECGRRVCELCIDPYTWTCINCMEKLKPKIVERQLIYAPPPINSMMKITLIGFLITFIGMLIMMIAAILKAGEVSGGIIIFPFIPIPLVIGFGPEAVTAVLLTIALAIAATIIFIITRRTQVEI
ncbi:MAG: hypothetical protein DRJ26_02405 [Candidatus Methanomethylicota archaeon]|uniref:B box-type domain-containing protein n=1 Tax=Thermoproteota archaeon TaxID=2056631 RepID=A0A497F529_9CREN|nr:MAG: hypothetical protein DRJ26_02405 [Candidatus Verstraetearchaeota archaeon]